MVVDSLGVGAGAQAAAGLLALIGAGFVVMGMGFLLGVKLFFAAKRFIGEATLVPATLVDDRPQRRNRRRRYQRRAFEDERERREFEAWLEWRNRRRW